MKKETRKIVGNIAIGVFLVGAALIFNQILAATVTSSVLVGNSAPTASAVLVNGGVSPITLNANATTSVTVSATVTDNNGCSDVFTSGTSTVYLYRSGFTSSSCIASQNPVNCYKQSFQTNSCTGTSTTAVATTTFAVQYFAQATDASSSFPGQFWIATVIVQDSSIATSSADSPSTVVLNTLTAINLATTTINYGTISANTNTGSTNQQVLVANVGNSSSTIQLHANPTLTSGSNIIATSSQVYASSSFTYGAGGVPLTGTAAAVSGFAITAPTSTATSSRTSFWGLAVPGGTATGTYTGTNVFTALFQ